MEAQLAEMREMLALVPGRTLGNLIVIKDNNEVKEELQVVMALIPLEDKD